ncbi:MAG: LLM class F420-dependent oxidoreductase [Actinomycetota bacterium]|nr:LLM class F420-dependent oxidoreductase [Actinomycetota bacterium]
MRLGIMAAVDNGGTLEQLIDQARVSHEAGVDTFWAAQTFGLDTLTALAVVGREVPGIELGTSVVPTYPRHPMMLAQQALTVQVAIGNRLCLGIGLSHRPVVEGMWGLSFDKPVRHLREYLSGMMPLLEGANVRFKGDVFTVRGAISAPGAQRPTVIVAALGEQMLRVAGALADGTTTWCVGPETLRNFTIPTIRQAAADAGRPEPRIVASLPITVTDDVDDARRRTGEELAMYNSLPSYRTMMDKEGVVGPADLAIVGSEAEVRDRLLELKAAGVSDFNAVIISVDIEERLRTLSVMRDAR